MPSPVGGADARRAIAASYGERGLAVAPERLVLTASSSESYGFLFKVLGDPGDAVLVPEPSYPLFDYLVRLEGLVPEPYRLAYDGAWHLDVATVDRALDACARRGQRVAAVVVVSPNNPTGQVLRAGELAALDQRAAAQGAALIADEVFADFVTRPSPDQVPCVAARATESLSFSLGGLSKSAGLPQMKLGWIAAGGPDAVVRGALARLELVTDTYLSVGTPAELALPELLRIGRRVQGAIAARVAENGRRLAAAVGPRSAVSVLASDGGWCAILRVPAVRSDEAWALALLNDDGVLLQPGYFFDLRGGTFLVVSLLPAPGVFAEGIARLLKRVDVVQD